MHNLERLFKLYYPALTLFAYKYVQDLEVAREIVQDLFVSLWEKNDQLRIKDAPKNYLYQAVRNRSLNYIKKKQRESIRLQEYADSMGIEPQFEQDPMELAELEARLYQCIKALPSSCQTVFILSRYQGKKNEEIAQELGISKRTVETHISKALRILRKKLYDKTGDRVLFLFSL